MSFFSATLRRSTPKHSSRRPRSSGSSCRGSTPVCPTVRPTLTTARAFRRTSSGRITPGQRRPTRSARRFSRRISTTRWGLCGLSPTIRVFPSRSGAASHSGARARTSSPTASATAGSRSSMSARRVAWSATMSLPSTTSFGSARLRAPSRWPPMVWTRTMSAAMSARTALSITRATSRTGALAASPIRSTTA